MPFSDELDLLDLTIKKFVRPQLHVNSILLTKHILQRHLQDEQDLQLLSVTRAVLMSDAQLAQALVRAGLEPHEIPMKHSEKQNKSIYAFSKTDPEFVALQKRGGKIGALVEARLHFKSTLELTRAQRLRDVGRVTYGKLPVPLKYYGAHTGRFSGMDNLNMQNLGRGSILREAITAPEGCVVLAGDLSQIEARLLATLAGQYDLVEQFANGEDVYASFASDIYGVSVHKDTHPRERFIGKTGILSLGYQAGARKFYTTMNDVHHTEISLDDAERVVNTYRNKYRRIVKLWGDAQDLIPTMHNGVTKQLGPLTTGKNCLILPNGFKLHYPKLKVQQGRWTYKSPTISKDLYGGKLVENAVQALARLVVTEAELRLNRLGLRAALSVHDELVFVVPEDSADMMQALVEAELKRPVAWLPELPVEAEVKYGANYGECK